MISSNGSTTHYSPSKNRKIIRATKLPFCGFHGAISYPVWSHRKMDHKDTTHRSYKQVNAFPRTTRSVLLIRLPTACTGIKECDCY